MSSLLSIVFGRYINLFDLIVLSILNAVLPFWWLATLVFVIYCYVGSVRVSKYFLKS